MAARDVVEKQCLIGVVVALLLILLGGSVLVYRSSASMNEARGDMVRSAAE